MIRRWLRRRREVDTYLDELERRLDSCQRASEFIRERGLSLEYGRWLNRRQPPSGAMAHLAAVELRMMELIS